MGKQKTNIPSGTVHNVPTDLRQVLSVNAPALETWSDITPLARNEWICWVTSAK